jgi:hypothetical protein
MKMPAFLICDDHGGAICAAMSRTSADEQLSCLR